MLTKARDNFSAGDGGGGGGCNVISIDCATNSCL